MAQRPSAGKRLREAAKAEKAKAKRERRAERAEEDDSDAPPPTSDSGESAADVMAQLQALHARFDDGDVDFETFEVEKQALLDRLA